MRVRFTNIFDVAGVEPMPELSATESLRLTDEFGDRLTAIVTNPYDSDIATAGVSAVAYDASGEIIGGGKSFIRGLPAGERAGAVMQLVSSGEVASLELYPMLYEFNVPPERWPSDVAPLVVKQSGWGDDTVGFTIENPNERYAFKDATISITAYNANDQVVGVTDLSYLWLMPNQTTGFARLLSTVGDEVAERLDIHIVAPELYEPQEPFSPFEVENVQVTEEAMGSATQYTLTFDVINPYAREIEAYQDCRVAILAYDAAGEIIGANQEDIGENLPPSGRLSLEKRTYLREPPARFEIFVNPERAFFDEE